MRKFIERNIFILFIAASVWVYLSLILSLYRVGTDDSCDKVRYIDYILYTKLLCEVKP